MADDRPVVALLAAVGIVLLLAAGVALTGIFGLFDTGEAGVVTESPTVPTPSDASPTETATTATQPFTLDTRAVESCGMLCRNVTSTVTNEQSTAAHNVTIRTRLYAGNDTDSEIRWQATERIAHLGPGETHVTTQQVELPLEDALAIRDADGWVTIQTTVESANRSVNITDRREVA